ncbi:DgyrCDS13740 [Dimorphilus gyrociliatus]|uniref:DgyrCDS13740 n=1 Tax=Dimorphilus gyrociliatus TaxID=2664684 RepID=A0A7I8WBQ3_9ANNE|nr:DgyrCDS13740 [Dimorphilus gyrociliatus]
MLPTRTPDSHMRRNPDCHVTIPNYYLQTIVPPHFYNDLNLLGYVNPAHRRLDRPYPVPAHPPLNRNVHRPVQNDDSTDLYPAHFRKGSIIELADGSLTRVEDLREEDLRKSAELSNEFHLDTSTLLKIERVHQSNVIQLVFGVGKSMIEERWKKKQKDKMKKILSILLSVGAVIRCPPENIYVISVRSTVDHPRLDFGQG